MQRAELRKWLSEIADEAGTHKKVSQAIKSVPFGHPHMQEVSHPDESSYLMTRISDELALMEGCTARSRGTRLAPEVATGEPAFASQNYQIAFQLQKGNAQTGTLTFNWALREGIWEITSFDLLTD